SRRRHTRFDCDWSSDVCSSDLDEPWFVLTGDALLVGDAGRPDLHAHGERTAEEMARALYRSLRQRLLALPDDLVLYPGHYSGSEIGRASCRERVETWVGGGGCT